MDQPLKRGEEIITVTDLKTQFGAHVIHDDLDFSASKGEVMGIVGGSGTGKSVLLRTMIGLIKPRRGDITILGHRVEHDDPKGLRNLQRRWGVLFQDGALFSSLTVLQNIEIPLIEHTDLPSKVRKEIAAVKLSLVGLPPDSAHKLPSEISGGMKKRAGVARALALDPELLFLDEPTAGLDPIGAANFDRLIRDLQDALGLTVVIVTHDLDTLHSICDRVSVLIDKRVKVGSIEELMREDHPWIQEYFNGPRGRAASAAELRRAAEGEG